MYNVYLLDEFLQHIEMVSGHERGTKERVQMEAIEIQLVPMYGMIVFEGEGGQEIGSVRECVYLLVCA